MYYFCTYFDINYLTRGLALYESLKKHSTEFCLWALCMDKESYDIISDLRLDALKPISLHEFEEGDKELLNAKQNRSRIEYYFTCTPSFPLFILNSFSKVNAITYIDADLYFFADPKPIFEEIGNNSIAIIEHRFAPHLTAQAINGIYNVSWVYFKREKDGISCLELWRKQCNQWCYDRVEDGKFADQKYLDNWPSQFKGVKIIKHKGANLAPWNIANYNIVLDNSNNVWIDDQPLVFYHFHGLQHILGNLYDSGLAGCRTKLTSTILSNIYLPYLSCMRTLESETAKKQLKKKSNIIVRTNSSQAELLSHISFKLLDKLKKLKKLLKSLFTKTYIILPESE